MLQSPLTTENWSLVTAIVQPSMKWSKDEIDNILRARHDSNTAGHPGYLKTLKSITKDFYWPSMRDDIKQIVGIQ